MASLREMEKRLEVLEAETAGCGGTKLITSATLYSTGAILSAAVDGQPVERLDGETDKDFRGRIIAKYKGPATLSINRIHYTEPKIIDIVYVESNGNGGPIEKADSGGGREQSFSIELLQ